jgi:uncharacterized membrane protein
MSNLILYNTLMGLAASVALLLMVPFARYGSTAPPSVRNAWAWTFAGLGGLLAVLGIHVSIAWPLLGAANIIFGEPSLLFGVLLLVAAAIIARTPIEDADEDITDVTVSERGDSRGELWRHHWRFKELPTELMVALRPVAYVGALGGVMVLLVGTAGAAFGTIVFRPPAAEWPTGLVAGTGLEIVYMVGTYLALGLGAVLLPVGLHRPKRLPLAGGLLTLGGVLLLFITLISFVGHVSMSAGAPPGGIPWPP